MRLKRIIPTDEYKSIPMRELCGRANMSVLGPARTSGRVEFKPVKSFERIKTGPTVIIKHGGGSLACDPLHRVLTVTGQEKYVNQLDNKVDKLVGISGPVEFEVADGPVADLYDLEIGWPHLYFTSGVVSHNSIFLCNNAVNSIRAGYDTLLVSFEMTAAKVARRCLGALTEVPLNDFQNHKKMIRDHCGRLYTTNKAQLAIYEMNPDQCSVEDVRNLMNMLRRTRGFSPKVLCLDYLELMVSRNSYYNRDEYVRQKHVSTEVCGLAKSEMVLLYSATQTNRSGSGAADAGDIVDLNKAAESYGKNMPPDYVISLNQSKAEYEATPPQVRGFVAKNREGEKFVLVTCNINYGNMKVREASL
jgi:hypothetical protein